MRIMGRGGEGQVENVDKTIDAICDWIRENLGMTSHNEQSVIVPEMVKALAELVSARDNTINHHA